MNADQAKSQVLAAFNARLEALRDLMTHEDTFTTWVVQVGPHSIYFVKAGEMGTGAEGATRMTEAQAKMYAGIVCNGNGEPGQAVNTESAILRSISELEAMINTINNA